MTSQTTRSEQKQRHAALAGEIADLLLSAESPVRNQEAFQQFHDEHGQCHVGLSARIHQRKMGTPAPRASQVNLLEVSGSCW